jgi:hypothetical protein
VPKKVQDEIDCGLMTFKPIDMEEAKKDIFECTENSELEDSVRQIDIDLRPSVDLKQPPVEVDFNSNQEKQATLDQFVTKVA